ncbi:alpha/beta fold hydrolase [Bacillus sp. EB106-08-02-XG196]|jgi:2-hydroxymuconate-semialdehyde hydrolase|uniref:alpha/beta fold hydrolase n=1 Tax=Bacillus sp. EB106-08-02-XG196 TaxID=2737049 RepID=UPI0015C4CFF7|nr:alpha/beta hydrolase [Bacillus sp. EB106-08-02-XG196]NWQ44156.1 alpha/beta fold hydrolase [Bacillus sp. EB106-08-02-XG196]
MSDVNTRKIQTGNYQTFINEGGDKQSSETIIFLHGSGPGVSAQSNWKEILPHFQGVFHVVAPDIFGFGNTDHPENYPKNGAEWMNIRVKQVIELMDAIEVDKAHLVGNSLGGVIALHLLMYAPERFDRVVLMGAGGGITEPTPELAKLANFHKDPDPVAFKNLLSWFLYDKSILEDKLEKIVSERLELFLRQDVRKSYEENFSKTHLSDMLVPPSALKEMKHEILLIHGHQDRFVPLQSSLYVMDYLPNAQLHIFKRCGHWAQVEQKERFIKLTSDFFNGEI